MQAIILIGGYGTRLYPLTYDTPKALLPIGNIIFLENMIKWFERNGIEELIFTLNHLAEPIIEFVENFPSEGRIRKRIVIEQRPLGSAGAVKNCEKLINDDFILFNGDILTDLNLKEIIYLHKKAEAVVTATLSRVDETVQYGIADLTDSGQLLGWQEKPTASEAKSNWGNVGAWVVSPKILDLIPTNEFTSLEKDTFPLIFREKLPFFGYRFSGYWKDIGTIEKYISANYDLLYGRIKDIILPGKEIEKGIWIASNAMIDNSAKLTPPMVIGENCQIGSATVIQGPTCIGDNTEIGPNSRLEGTILWKDTKIGRNTKISNSIIASSIIQDDCIVGNDSVVSPGTFMTEATILNPGTVLGPKSQIT